MDSKEKEAITQTMQAEAEVNPTKPDQKIPVKTFAPLQADLAELLIPIVSVLSVLFTAILVITLILINTGIRLPKLELPVPVPVNSEQDHGNNTSVTDRRDHPVIATVQNKRASMLYRAATGVPDKTLPELYSKSAILIDVTKGYTGNSATAEKSTNEQLQIASMTKVMTLIVCCDYINEKGIDSLYDVIKIKADDKRLAEYSCAFFIESEKKEGTLTENIYVIDALYGLIMRSGADCAYALAEHFAGSEEAFVVRMNAKANELGMINTTFSNCIGKDYGGENGKVKNVSTVIDVATMFAYALDNPFCYDIITAQQWECIGNYTDARVYTMHPLVYGKYKNNKDKYGSAKVIGGKSGNETLAGYCLVSLLESSGGRRYICVTAGNRTTESSYDDTIKICNALLQQ